MCYPCVIVEFKSQFDVKSFGFFFCITARSEPAALKPSVRLHDVCLFVDFDDSKEGKENKLCAVGFEREGVAVAVNSSVASSGMSVLQCASVALKAAVRELENCEFPHQARLQSLRQEQMMETLECLLQMGSYLHTMVRHWGNNTKTSEEKKK